MPFLDWKGEYTKVKALLKKQWQQMYQTRKLRLFHGFISDQSLAAKSGSEKGIQGVPSSLLYKAEKLFVNRIQDSEFDQLVRAAKLDDPSLTREQ